MHLTHSAIDGPYSSFRDEPGAVLHIVRDLRGDIMDYPHNIEDDNTFFEEPDYPPRRAPPTRRRTLPSTPAQPISYLPTYSREIQDLARSLPSHPLDKAVFSSIWGDILANWFPPEEAFVIEKGWDPDVSASVISYAVLHRDRPLVLLDIRGALDSTNDVTRQRARAAANQIFDDIAPHSYHDTLCVISAFGLKWNAFRRPTYLKSEDARLIFGYDWFGEWEEDIVSVASFDILGHCFQDIKTSCLLHD